VAQHLNAVLALGEDALLQQVADVDGGAILELVQSGDIDGLQTLGKNVVKTTLGQTTSQRHLAALEAHTDTAAGTSPLTLVSTAGSLAVTGTGAAALALAHLSGTSGGRESMQIHVGHLLRRSR